jgi:hypothetical protein
MHCGIGRKHDKRCQGQADGYAVRPYNEPSAYVCGQVGCGDSREGPLESPRYRNVFFTTNM